MRVHVHTHTGSRHSGRRPPEMSQSLHGLPSLRFTPRGSGRPCLEADEGSEGSEERRPGRGGRQKEEGERACRAAAAARPCPPPGDAGAEPPARDAGAKTPAAPRPLSAVQHRRLPGQCPAAADLGPSEAHTVSVQEAALACARVLGAAPAARCPLCWQVEGPGTAGLRRRATRGCCLCS